MTDESIITDFSIAAKSLINTLLIRNPQERSTVHEALQSGWILCELEDLKELYRLRIERAN